MVNDRPVDTPPDISDGTSTEATYKHLPDGVHYFHLKAMRHGIWGGVTNYGFRVDNTVPAAFTINVLPTPETPSKNPVFQFETTDNASGIDHYEIKIIALTSGGGEVPNKKNNFIEVVSPHVANLDIGKYQVIVRAYDIAGNFYDSARTMAVVSPLFDLTGSDGLSVSGVGVIPWWYIIAFFIVFLTLIVYHAHIVWTMQMRQENKAAASLEEWIEEKSRKGK
jgi:hypothetical protein